MENSLSMETLRRVKRGETFDPVMRQLSVFIAERRTPDHLWCRAAVFEKGVFTSCSWHCHTEEEAVKWFNTYTELYGPPRRGEFLGFKYDSSDKKVSEAGWLPPMSCGS